MTCDHEELFTRYAAGELGEAEAADARHAIESCDVCRNRLEDLHANEPAGAGHVTSTLDAEPYRGVRPPRAAEPKRSFPSWLVVVPVLVAAVLGVYVITNTGESAQPEAPAEPPPPVATQHTPPTQVPRNLAAWREVKVVKAPYSAPRPQPQPPAPDGSPSPPRVRETPFDRAMRPYGRNDFAEAATALAPLARSGDIRASFYLGVSLLLTDRPEEAVEPLTRVARAWRGQLGAQAQYYLAVAHLRTYRFQEALLELRAVQDLGGPYAARAAELEDEVRTSAL
jgi:hypothetical protein